MIKRKIIKPGWWEVTITPDEIARELYNQHKAYGVSSGSTVRLAQDRARRKFKTKTLPYYIGITIVPTPDMPISPYRETNTTIMREWARLGKTVKLGLCFSFSSSYADLPDVLGIHEFYGK